MRVRVVGCDNCGRRREDVVGDPWFHPHEACFCGSDDYSVEFEFIRYCDYGDDPDAYFLIPEAAELVEMDEKELLDLCEKGLIDSMLEETLTGEPLRLFESVSHFHAHGPNELMTFEQAMAYVADSSMRPFVLSRYVRRPSWRGVSCVGWGDDSKSDPPNTSFHSHHETGFERYCPTEDDRIATDWFICRR